MDWKLFFMTSGAIFLAELADKTQLVSMSITAKSGKPIIVFLASLLAYSIVTIISVYVGSICGKYLRADIIRYGAAAIFVVIGIFIFLNKG